MEAAEGAKTVTVLRRLVAWSERIFDLSAAVIAPVSDRRPQPRIPTAVVVKSALVMFWARMGSLNALELSARAGFWKKWLAAPSCSADTMGRVHALIDAGALRQGIHHIYERLKRNKALPDTRGMGVAVVDGHESHTSYLQHCSGCLERTLHLPAGDRILVLSPAGNTDAALVVTIVRSIHLEQWYPPSIHRCCPGHRTAASRFVFSSIMNRNGQGKMKSPLRCACWSA